MIFRIISALLAVLLLIGPVEAGRRGVGFQAPAGAVNWSTLGVIADGVTDNTAALNALPLNTPIIGDCPASAKLITYTGQHILQSGLTIYQRPECMLECFFVDANLNHACHTQAGNDLTSPITNVFWYGYREKKPDLTYQNRLWFAWIDHFKMLNFRIDTYKQAFYIRGSDQEFGPCYATNSLPSTGSDFIRQFGNVPLVATSQPGNVWIHGCYSYCGDACFQIGQPFTIQNWGNTNTDGVKVEDSVGISSNSSALLIGQPGVVDTGANNFYIRHVLAQRIRGTGANSATYVAQTMTNAQEMSDIYLDYISLDGTNSNSPNGLFNLDSSFTTSAGLRNVTLDHVACVNSFQRCIVADGPINGLTIKNSTFGTPRGGALNNVTIGQGPSNVVVDRNAIAASLSSALSIGQGAGQSVSSSISSITNNIMTGISSNQSGALFKSSDTATMTGNVAFQIPGAVGVRGATLTLDNGALLGTHGANVTGNDFSNISGSTQVVCAPGQGNSVTGNAGAADCP